MHTYTQCTLGGYGRRVFFFNFRELQGKLQGAEKTDESSMQSSGLPVYLPLFVQVVFSFCVCVCVCSATMAFGSVSAFSSLVSFFILLFLPFACLPFLSPSPLTLSSHFNQ